MADSARTLVEEVLSPDMTREIWSGNYLKALPVSLQLFELSAVLPAVFYMFRFGQRRGTGHFLRAFGAHTGTARHRRQSATVASVAGALASADGLDGFNGECERGVFRRICGQNGELVVPRQTPQRARVLATVKARRSAPPPLRGADGLDGGCAHARPALV